MLYRRNAIIVDDGLKAVTRPAAMFVEPDVSWCFSTSEHVGPARQGEVVGHAAAGDTTADDDDSCLIRAHDVTR